MFGETSETLNAVDMTHAARKLMVPMRNLVMLRVADIYKAVVTAPSIQVNNRIERDPAANNRLQSSSNG